MDSSFPMSLWPLTAGKAKHRGTEQGREETGEDEHSDLFSTAALCAQSNVPKF